MGKNEIKIKIISIRYSKQRDFMRKSKVEAMKKAMEKEAEKNRKQS